MTETLNKTLVRRYYEEVLNRRNPGALDELLAPTFVSYLPDGTPLSRERYMQSVTMSQAAFPDLQVTIHDQIAEGDRVVTRWSAQGTHLGLFAGLPATGKTVHVTAIHIHRVLDEQLVEHWEELNMLGVLQQLGLSVG